ncbi:MAG: thioredoxin family protein [Candidatus Bathyarchaeia archaeon]
MSLRVPFDYGIIEIITEVIGKPQSPETERTLENVKAAASKLKSIQPTLVVTIKELDITSKEVTTKYGVLTPPALATNGVIKIVGRVPDEEEVIESLKEAASTVGIDYRA